MQSIAQGGNYILSPGTGSVLTAGVLTFTPTSGSPVGPLTGALSGGVLTFPLTGLAPGVVTVSGTINGAAFTSSLLIVAPAADPDYTPGGTVTAPYTLLPGESLDPVALASVSITSPNGGGLSFVGGTVSPLVGDSDAPPTVTGGVATAPFTLPGDVVAGQLLLVSETYTVIVPGGGLATRTVTITLNAVPTSPYPQPVTMTLTGRGMATEAVLALGWRVDVRPALAGADDALAPGSYPPFLSDPTAPALPTPLPLLSTAAPPPALAGTDGETVWVRVRTGADGTFSVTVPTPAALAGAAGARTDADLDPARGGTYAVQYYALLLGGRVVPLTVPAMDAARGASDITAALCSPSL